nr:creatininase family protein [Sinorhizobium fredii]
MQKAALAILPIGSLEQHGPHLPVVTDTASASEAAIRAARRVAAETPVAVLPGLWLRKARNERAPHSLRRHDLGRL